MKKNHLLSLCFLLLTSTAFGQKLVGFFPDYRSASINQVEYDKMTDVVFAFLNFNEWTGALNLSNEAVLDQLITQARSVNPNIRIHVSTGGGAYGGVPFTNMTSNAGARTTFVTQMANLIQNKNLDGWDLDWEFPGSAADRNNHELLLQQMRTALDAKEGVMGKKLDVSIAVNAEFPWAGTLYNTGVVNYIDYAFIMAFDGSNAGVPGAPNHSSLAFANQAMDDWENWGLPYCQQVLGVPFYGRPCAGCWTADTYASIASSNPAYYYTQDLGFGWYYNGANTLANKVDAVMANGGGGIFIWEVAQDRMGLTYSLLNGLHQKFTNDYGLNSSLDPCSPLPLYFTHFTAKLQGDITLLSWQATTQTNGVFSIYRSEDGRSYERIYMVESSNKQLLYTFTDVAVGEMSYYYIVYEEGETTEKSLVKVVHSGKPIVSIYPQPAHEELVIKGGGFIKALCHDMNGQQVLEQQLHSEQTTLLNVQHLKPGIYILTLYTDADNRYRYKIVIE